MKNYRSMLIIIFLVLLTWQKSSGQYLLHGYTPDIFPSDTVVNVGGENVIAQWFVTPVNGTIEYVYLMIGDTITAVDSIGFLRIHRSNISPGRGPGFDYPSPPVKWGGYKNTNVSDSTFAAFIENATDTHWISTVPYEIPSFPPWGDELWGFGGYPLILRPTMISVDVRFFFYPYVQRGEAFVVSIRVKGGQNTSGYPTQFLASKTHDTLSRAWIFYPNDSGWQALGKLNFNIWVGISTGDNFNRITYPKGWNMLCVPKDVTDKRKTIIFLCAGSDAYGYNNGYSTFDTLHNGKGYWIKFDSPCAADFRGEYLFEESTEVRTGWNLIGTPSIEIPLEHVYSFPEGNISSGFYRYNSGYLLSDVLSVGNGYWVKVNEDGIILLSYRFPHNKPTSFSSNTQVMEELNFLRFIDVGGNNSQLYFGVNDGRIRKEYFELPPKPPVGVFDVRFRSGFMLETFSSEMKVLPIDISSAEYPLTISWEMKSTFESSTLFINKKAKRLTGKGSVTVYQEPEKVTLLLDELSNKPEVFVLEQNYPNPFNPSTNFGFRIANFGLVSLKVFDVLGREVVTLVNEKKEAGKYSVRWNADGLPSGVYYYKLQAGEFSSVKKLLLMR